MEQLKEYLKRLRVSAEVSRLAMEYFRLSELKCPRGSLSSASQAIICIELASNQKREPLEKKEIQKWSGLQPKAYLRSYQMVEKLLGLSSSLTVQELAVRLSLLEAVGLAEEILGRYRKMVNEKYSSSQREGLDLHKPLYTACALYCSCKLLKIRCNRSQFLSNGMTTLALFQNVLDEMNKLSPENPEEFSRRGKKRRAEEELEEEDSVELRKEPSHRRIIQRERLHDRILSSPMTKEYLEWKEKTIREAREELKRQKV